MTFINYHSDEHPSQSLLVPMFAPINHYPYEKHLHGHFSAPPGNTNVTAPSEPFSSENFLIIDDHCPEHLDKNPHLRGMLEQIDQLANEDIEMQVSSPMRSFPLTSYFRPPYPSLPYF